MQPQKELTLRKKAVEKEIAREAIERLSTFLRKLGYVVNDFHEYTQSWKTRSGKFGYLFFRLPREGEE